MIIDLCNDPLCFDEALFTMNSHGGVRIKICEKHRQMVLATAKKAGVEDQLHLLDIQPIISPHDERPINPMRDAALARYFTALHEAAPEVAVRMKAAFAGAIAAKLGMKEAALRGLKEKQS